MIFDSNNIAKEFAEAELWDTRCNKSLYKISEKILDNSHLSFSAACGKSLRQNGGRIFSNKNMNTEKLQNGHYKETQKRAEQHEVILCAQDTTSFNYTSHKAATGLGTIGPSKNQKGVLAHTTIALTPSGLPLGIISQQYWTRLKETYGKKKLRKNLKIESKESNKWPSGLKAVIDRFAGLDKEIWVIGDRESDIYEYYAMERPENIFILSRAVQPREIEVTIKGKTHKGKLNEIIEILPEVGEREVEFQRSNKTVNAKLSVKASTIKLHPSKRLGKNYPKLEMSVVYASEKTKKEDPISWILLTDKTDLSKDEVFTMLDYYTQRWKVERFHYTLKTGVFNVEKLQFHTAHELKNALSFYSVLAWKTMQIQYYGRVESEAPAEDIIDNTEREILETTTGKEIKTAEQVLFAIGELGGFLGGSKRYPYPGVKVLWLGIIKLQNMKEGWLLFKNQLPKDMLQD